MKATIVYDASTRLSVVAVRHADEVSSTLSMIERATGDQLDRDTLVVESGVHLVNEIKPGDVLVVDEGDFGIEVDGFEFRYAVRRPVMSSRAAYEAIGGDVSIVDDREGAHVLRWNEVTRTWSESRSCALSEIATLRRIHAAERALEILGADPVSAHNVVNAIASVRKFNRVEPIIVAGRRALAL